MRRLLSPLSTEQLWRQLGDSAPIGFHAIHIAGATDRLLTYARGERLTDAQLEAARAGEKTVSGLDASEIIGGVERAMDRALDELRKTPESALFTARAVGRKLLPSTTLGLIAHAAEHAYRHAGQIATLARIIADTRSSR